MIYVTTSIFEISKQTSISLEVYNSFEKLNCNSNKNMKANSNSIEYHH